jgi:hypothetical protein
VAHAGVLDIDQAALLGLQRIARIELSEPVGAHDLPVRAAGEHLAAEIRSLESAAEDRNNAPPPARHLA